MHDLSVIIARDLAEDRKMRLKKWSDIIGFRLKRLQQMRAYQIFRESRREIPREILKTLD